MKSDNEHDWLVVTTLVLSLIIFFGAIAIDTYMHAKPVTETHHAG
jgi:hypothetical protein